MNYLYLLLDLSIMAAPLLLSFGSRVHFVSNWKIAFLSSLLITVLFFILGALFTTNGMLGLNPVYSIKVNLLNIPLEELLFLLVASFSVVFIYECCKYYLQKRKLKWFNRILIVLLFVYALISVLLYGSCWYTIILLITTVLALVFWALNEALEKIGLTFIISLVPSLLLLNMIRNISVRNPTFWSKGNISNYQWINNLEFVLFSFTLVVSILLIYEYFQKLKYK